MQKIIIIIYMLTTILCADLEEANNNKITNIYSKQLNKTNNNNILLLPFDINQTLVILEKYNKKYEIFDYKKKITNKYQTMEELIEFYSNSIKEDKEIKITSVMQFLIILAYQKNILLNLKKDLDKKNFSHENKIQLLDNIENSLILDKIHLYKLIEVQNKYYAKNVKKYFFIMKKKAVKNIMFTDAFYQKFLFYLNRGKELAFQGIEINDFSLFNKYIENELKISNEEIDKIKKTLIKNPKETFLYTDYWIRTQVYKRYLGKGNAYLELIEKIKKQKEFFKKLKKY